MIIYNITKIIHLIAMISWMVGLFYLPRLYVYHCTVKKDSDCDKTFQIMERKLLKIIMNPAMIITFISGLYLISFIGFAPWLHFKLVFVLFLAAFHGYLSSVRKKFANHSNLKSDKFYRIIIQIPTILLIVIISSVVFKPF